MIQLNQRVKADGREGITVRKGRKNLDAFWWCSMDDTGMLQCFAEGLLEQLEDDRPKPKRVRKEPPQKETIFPLEEYENHVALTDETRDTFKV